MRQYNTDDVVLALASAPIDARTGNRVLYSASWLADTPSMIGERNEDWVRREIDWFFTGSDALADMEGPVPQAFQACAGTDGKVNSAYGHILFGKGEHLPPQPSLADRIINAFIQEGKHTRHAVAIISDRNVHRLARHNERNDFICTNALNEYIDHEDKLHIVAQMRSMDAVWGYRADYSMWDALMDWLLGSLEWVYPEVTRGPITFQVGNLHVYPRHHDLLLKQADIVDDKLERLARRAWMDQTIATEKAQEQQS